MSRAIGTGGQGDSIVPFPKDSEDQLTLFQLGGGGARLSPPHFITSPKPLPHGFSDLPTALIKKYKEHQPERQNVQFPSQFCETEFLENCIADRNSLFDQLLPVCSCTPALTTFTLEVFNYKSNKFL